MKWIGISGSWRKTTKEIETKLRNIVREIIRRGDGIVSGGALGVDFIALDEALKHDSKAERIKIFLPTTFKVYTRHLRKHASLGTITSEQAENLISQLSKLKQINPKALIENPNSNFTEETKKQMYYQRNSAIVNAADELIAFRVRTKESEGLGTLDTIEKAQRKGIPVKVFQYDLTEK
jgi:predicted Rossmann-fold nucleotide-binding protein